MRHRLKKRSSFGLKSGPRKALLKNLISSLVEKERIKTTLSKAKGIRPLVERAITIGKSGEVASRRILMSRYAQKKTVSKIVDDLSQRFKERPGGYTRIIKLGFRQGDRAEMAYIEFVDYDFSLMSEQKESQKEKTVQKDDKKSKEKSDKKLNNTKALYLRKKKKKQHIRKIQSNSRKVNRKTK